jgi:undecaprenyl diphosphate synthase
MSNSREQLAGFTPPADIQPTPIFVTDKTPRTSIYDRFPDLREIPQGNFPGSLAITPDGNRRDARFRDEEVIKGQKRGVQVALEICRDLRELPIKNITIWGFSADNWGRSTEEVDGLMTIFEEAVVANLNELMEDNVRFVHLGRKDRIPESLQKTIKDAETRTAENTGQILSLAIDFGGDDQQARMAQEVVRRVQTGEITNAEEITPAFMDTLRDGNGLVPPADLLIRTSGEYRTSDIGWLNGKQTELAFINKLFPLVTTEDIVESIVDFYKRQRRMGK